MSQQEPKPSSEGAAGPSERKSRWTERLRIWLFGKPKEIHDRSLFHSLSLVPFLAWVGLGADGLSSSSYGPEEAFRTLGEHTYLAVGLAVLSALTVMLIATAYSRIIEAFPHGGGGYVVATKLLGERVGVISGCALLVDYVLTITVSIAASGDAFFSFLPPHVHHWKLPLQLGLVLLIMGINIRGVKESVMSLMPIFVLFLITHAILIVGGFVLQAPNVIVHAKGVVHGFRHGLDSIGIYAMLLLFVHAYSLGGGTYTGIEAVSNGLPMMREPRVQTAKRTMVYMSISLAVCAAGLLFCYLLWDVRPDADKTLNAVLLEKMTHGFAGGHIFTMVTLATEGALLVVAAQAGFLDGPRVLANMAVDSWVPRRFAALSDRFITQNGILLMGAASFAALFFTHGDVRYLVVMYSINVFVTFSLSMFGMAKTTIQNRKKNEHWRRQTILFCFSFLFCATILAITLLEKFTEGGWITLVATTCVVALCYMTRAHYRATGLRLAYLYEELHQLPLPEHKAEGPLVVNREEPTAVVLVANFAGLGIHTFLNIFQSFPGFFKNVVFISVGVIDSGEFKGEDSVEALEKRVVAVLKKYEDMADSIGIPHESRWGIATDAIHEAEKICMQLASEYSHIMFFAGKIVFPSEAWWQPLLHNETAFAIQKRLQWAGLTMTILPARLH